MTPLNEISLDQFSKLNLVSAQIAKTSAERRNIMRSKGESRVPQFTKLIQSKLVSEKNYIDFMFLSEATPEINEPKKNVNPDQGFSKEDNPSKLYDLQMRFKGVDELSGQKELTLQQVKVWMWNTDFQIWSSSPALHWQGINFSLSQIDASIHPTNIKPQHWDKIHGETLLDKHLVDLFLNLKFFLNQMAGSLLNKIRGGVRPKRNAKPKETEPMFNTEPNTISASNIGPSEDEEPIISEPTAPQKKPEVQKKPASPNAPVQPQTLQPKNLMVNPPEEVPEEPEEPEEKTPMSKIDLTDESFDIRWNKNNKDVLFEFLDIKGVFSQNTSMISESVKYIDPYFKEYGFSLSEDRGFDSRKFISEGLNNLNEVVMSLDHYLSPRSPMKIRYTVAKAIQTYLSEHTPDVLVFNLSRPNIEESMFFEKVVECLDTTGYSLNEITSTSNYETYFFLIKEQYNSVLFSNKIEEASGYKTLVYTYIMANPPTSQHLRMFKTVEDTAKKLGGKGIIILGGNGKSSAIFSGKRDILSRAFPSLLIINAEGKNQLLNFYDTLIWAYEKHFQKVIAICGQDQVQEYTQVITDNNDKTTQAGFFKFEKDNVKAISWGNRNPDRSEEAIKSRNAILNKDYKAFMHQVDIPYISTLKNLWGALRAQFDNIS